MSEDTTCRVWSLVTGKEIIAVQGMSPLAGKNVRGLAVCEGMVATGAEDSSVRVFEADGTNSLVVSSRVPLPGQSSVTTEVFKGGKMSEKVKASYNLVKCVCMKGDRIYFATSFNQVLEWNPETTEITTLYESQWEIFDICASESEVFLNCATGVVTAISIGTKQASHKQICKPKLLNMFLYGSRLVGSCPQSKIYLTSFTNGAFSDEV